MNKYATRSSVLSIVAAASTTAAAIWMVQKSREKRTRRAKYTCSCGKVEADIIVPAENYRYMEIPSFQCCCCDCVGFCEKVLQYSHIKGFLSPGAKNLVMYDSEIVFKSGGNQLRTMKLSESTPNRRIYSRCCATPLAISMEGAGVTLIYTNNLKKANPICDNEVPLPDLPPMVCFFSDSSSLDGVKSAKGYFAPKVIGHCIGRMALLRAFGKNGPGKGFPIDQVEIGMDSISKAFKPKRVSSHSSFSSLSPNREKITEVFKW